MNDYSFLISDIEIEYKKYFDIIKKKYSKIKNSCESALNSIDSLKKLIPENINDENAVSNFKSELNKSSQILLNPIYLVQENKYTKLYLNALSLLKRIVAYNLISETEYSKIINHLKDFFTNQSEDIQLKVLEILQHIISGNIVKLTEENINNIMNLCKIDNIKGHTKNIECKSVIKLLLNTLVKKIFDISDENNVLNFLKNLMKSIEGNINNIKEWNNLSMQNSLTKSTKIELLCQILESFYDKFKNGESAKFIEEDMNVFLRKILQINQDQLIGAKLYRLIFIIITYINKNYIILEEVLKNLNKTTQIKWQKILGLELLSELFKKGDVLLDIYEKENNLYQNIFQTFTNITYNTIILKQQKLKEKKSAAQNNQNANNKKQSEHNIINIIPNKKHIMNNNIYINETSINYIISTNINYVFKLLIESYISLKNSYVFLMDKNGININKTQQLKDKDKVQENNKNINLTEAQEKIKQMITFNFADFKGGFIGILLYQNDVSSVQSFLGIFQSFIYIYTSFNLPELKDELLNDLCNLAIPNNLQNILEIKEKNILMIRTIFNLSHCTNLLEKNSWKIFIRTVQNLYYILIKNGYYIYGEKQQFDIEYIIKNIYSNIKKYSFESTIIEVQKAVKEDELNKNNTITNMSMKNNTKEKINKKKMSLSQIRVLTLEEKENIDILTNLVNNLFIDSNDYDNETLINVIDALYEDIEDKIKFYNKELKSAYDKEKNTEKEKNEININTENKRKISEGDLQNNNINNSNKEENINNNIGKLTVRNPLYKSVMAPIKNNIESNVDNKDNKISKFNINFQNSEIIVNLSNINFNLVKILEISIINISRIDLILDKINSIIKLFSLQINQNNSFTNTLFKFTVEALAYLIIHILIKFKIKDNINNNDKKDINQNDIFSPFLNLLNGNFNDFHIKSEYMVNPLKNILEKCGTQLDTYGWSNFFECISLILNDINNKNKLDIIFKMIEQILNEYSDNLSIFNIEILLDILEKFSLQSEDKNISYSSLSFFWQCADIIEKYQKNKKDMKDLELNLNKEKIKNEEDKINFYENLWKKLFHKLLIINKDKRFDIKKSGINLFSQFFVAKIKIINEINNLSNYIFENIFLNIFTTNSEEYLSFNNNSEINAEKENNNLNINITNSNNTNNSINKEENNEGKEKEELTIFSLQNLGKILKSLIEENKLNKNSNNKIQLEFIKKISSLYQELISKKNTPEICTNILKNITEFESGDKLYFQQNRQIFWEIMIKIINYVSENSFIEMYAKSVKGNKVIQGLIDTFISSFYSKDDFDIINQNENINNNINEIIDITKKLMNVIKIMDKSLIHMDEYSLVKLEKNIFNLIESIGIYCNNFADVENIFNYLLSLINYVKEDKHSIAISGQSAISLGNILLGNKNYTNYMDEEKIKNMIIFCKNQMEEFYALKSDKDMLNELIKHNIKKKDKFIWEKILESFTFNDAIIKSTLYKVKDEKFWEEIINYLIKLYKSLDSENNKKEKSDSLINESKEIKGQSDDKNPDIIIVENNEIKEEFNKEDEKKENHEDKEDNDEIKLYLIKSDSALQKNIINIIMNILLPNSGNVSANIQQKLLNLFEISNNNKDENNNEKLFSIENMNTENLFNICHFKEETELSNLLNEKEEEKESLKKYIEIKKIISKKFLPILFQNCIKDINNYIEKEKNGEDIADIEEKIIMILDGLKNLDSFCGEIDGDFINKENEIIKVCLNNKKAHLFIFQKYLNKLILTKNEKIRKKLCEVYDEISKQFEL